MTRLYNIGSFDNPVYLLGAKGNWTLIEGGISSQFVTVKNRLYAIVENASEIKHWIILHTHYDHCGLLSYLYPSLPEVQVYAGKKACKNLGREKSIRVIENLNLKVTLLKNNVETLENIQRFPLNDIPVQQLKEGEVMHCGKNLMFSVIETPGHSDCSISLFEQHSGRLFVSDALGELFSPKEWFPLAFSNISDYLNSIALLKTTAPKSIALGHGEYLLDKEAREAFQYSTVSTHKIIEEVQQQLKTRNDEVVVQLLHQKYAYNSQGFVPEGLHYSSMKRLVGFIADY